MSTSCNETSGVGADGRYARYTPEQVETMERLYHECPNPSSFLRQQLIRECPTLSNIEPKQIKVWFQNRRCRDKQRKDSSRLHGVNKELAALNKLLAEENDRLQKQVTHLECHFRENHSNKSLATKDTSSESVVTSGQQQPHLAPRDASPAGLLSIAEDTLTEFLSKATGTAVGWVQMPGMKTGPDSIGFVAVCHGCTGVAARACGLVGLEPARVVEILKNRHSWLRECRSMEVINVLPSANGGTIELLYMQFYAPTTLAPGRDFWLFRYTSIMEDGNLVICETSLNNTQNGPSIPPAHNFVRAEMLPSGYLIRPCDGGSIINIVDHMNLEAWSVLEVLRPLYESSTALAHKITIAALRQLKQVAQDISQSNVSSLGQRPAALRALNHRLIRGFNEALNGFSEAGWLLIGSNDGRDDVTILVNSDPESLMGLNVSFSNAYTSISNSVLCAKASMLLQNVPPAILIRFLREHSSEWAVNVDAYSASVVKIGPSTFLGARVSNFGSQVFLPLTQTIEHEELLEIIKLEGVVDIPEDAAMMPRDILLLQTCTGMDENAVGTCSELIFAPVDASFTEDSPLLSSGFRIIPLDSGKKASIRNCTLDLALETGPTGSRRPNDLARSIMTMAFQFACESHMQDSVAQMAMQYVRSIISSVQRVALSLSSSPLGLHGGLHPPLRTPEAQTLARWIFQSYRSFIGVELLNYNSEGRESILRAIWHYSDAVLCCSVKVQAVPVFTFANQAGLDMLETTLVALQDLSMEKIFDDNGRKNLYSEFPQILHQGFATLQGGVCSSSMGRPVSYERAVAWKVVNDENNLYCLCFMFVNWSLV